MGATIPSQSIVNRRRHVAARVPGRGAIPQKVRDDLARLRLALGRVLHEERNLSTRLFVHLERFEDRVPATGRCVGLLPRSEVRVVQLVELPLVVDKGLVSKLTQTIEGRVGPRGAIRLIEPAHLRLAFRLDCSCSNCSSEGRKRFDLMCD